MNIYGIADQHGPTKGFVYGFRWISLASVVSFAAFTFAQVFLVAVVDIRCGSFQEWRTPYIEMALVWLTPWLVAALLQFKLLRAQSVALDIWRAMSVWVAYEMALGEWAGMPITPDLFGTVLTAAAGCPLNGLDIAFLHSDLYVHDDMSHFGSSFLLYFALALAYLTVGLVKGAKRLMNFVAEKPM